MAAPASVSEFLDLLRKSNQVDPARLDPWMAQNESSLPKDPKKLAQLLISKGVITRFQAEQFLQGKYKGFNIGNYRLIERLGAGGNGTVYLAEHEIMKRRVALKVLPPQVASDPGTLERFRREAQAVAALDHPNIVRAYDFRQEGQLYVFVMEYVDGPSLQQVIDSKGALNVAVACDYIRQAALGLHYAHEQGLVHRDIKPANLLVDSQGIVKVLDLGLARFVPQGQESLTKKFDEGAVMGTADYLAPEQAISMHDVDHRADLYSLGATFYTLLAGETPFPAGNMTQKLLWHQMQEPTPIQNRNGNVPDEVADLIAAMMTKSRDERIQTALEIAEALEPFCPESPTSQSGVRLGTSSQGPSSRHRRSSTRLNSPASQAERQTGRLREAPTKVEGRADESEAITQTRPSKKVQTTKKEQASSVTGILWLCAGIGAFLLLIGGVLAFIFLGPAPNAATTEKKPEVIETPKRPIVQQPRRTGSVTKASFVLNGHSNLIESATFSNDGSFLLTASRDHTIRFWNTTTKQLEKTLPGHEGFVFQAVFNHNRERILSGSADGTVRLWNAGGQQLKRIDALGSILAVCFGRNDTEAIGGCDDHSVKVWNLDNGALSQELKGHTDLINAVVLRPGPERKQVVSVSSDKTIRLWNLDSGKQERIMTGQNQILSLAVDFRGRQAVTGDSGGLVQIWDLDVGALIGTLTGHSGPVYAVAVSPDGRHIISGGADEKIIQWNIFGRKEELTYREAPGAIFALAYSPRGEQIASCQGQTVRLWEASDGP